MRILHISPYYAPAYVYGGVVRAVEGMVRALVQRGHSITVLTTDALDQFSRVTAPADEMLEGVRVLRVPNLSARLRGRLNLSTPNKMGKVARNVLPDVDIVHVHEFRTVENLLVTPSAARLGKAIVLSPHGTLRLDTGRGLFKAAWDRLFSPALALRIDHVIGLTQAEAAEAQAYWAQFGRRRVPTAFSVVPNGINPAEFANLTGGEDFRQQYGLGASPVCLFMGRLHPRKGVDVLVKAFKTADVPDARLVIVGPDEGLRATLESLLDERITLTGYLSGAARLAAYAAADMLALPAVGEGLPMVVLEAMGAGLPVIVSPECNLPEVSAAGAGIEVPPQVEPLAAALRVLLTDAAKRATMGAAARRLIQERFTWEVVAVQLERVYRHYVTR